MAQSTKFSICCSETDIKLWRTYDVAIHHAFGCKDVSKITKVLSHPQALKQCRLAHTANYPKLEHVAVTMSTAAAIQTALVHTSSAAIGGQNHERCRTANRRRGNRRPDNTTRFGIVSAVDPFPVLSARRWHCSPSARRLSGLASTSSSPRWVYVRKPHAHRKWAGWLEDRDYYFFRFLWQAQMSVHKSAHRASGIGGSESTGRMVIRRFLH